MPCMKVIDSVSCDVSPIQEVTPEIYDIFQHSGWWKMYSCSISNVMELTRGYFCMQVITQYTLNIWYFMCILKAYYMML